MLSYKLVDYFMLLQRFIVKFKVFYSRLGYYFSPRFRKIFYNQKKIRKDQDSNLYTIIDSLKNDTRLVVFYLPPEEIINGGVLSIFTLAAYSRKLNLNTYLFTVPNKLDITYIHNSLFLNNELIFRQNQLIYIINNFNIKSLVLHIPECYIKSYVKYCEKFTLNQFAKKNILHINILNQNINLMPEPSFILHMKKQFKNSIITQTTAHSRYANQNICNRYHIPTHLFSTYRDLSNIQTVPFEQKSNIIILSPDDNIYRNKIVELLQNNCKDFRIITIKNMPYETYLKYITKAYFVITFGEGFDGYLLEAIRLNTVGIAVYNMEFFPNEKWKNLRNIFNSYEDLCENLVNFINELLDSKKVYNDVCFCCQELYNQEYQEKAFNNNLKRFYESNYDFYPKTF